MLQPKILYEDEDLIVLEKPSGMTVNKADTTKGEITLQDWISENFQFPISNFQLFILVIGNW